MATTFIQEALHKGDSLGSSVSAAKKQFLDA